MEGEGRSRVMFSIHFPDVILNEIAHENKV